MPKENLKDYEKGDKGIRYQAGITSKKIKKGEMAVLVFKLYNPTNKVLTPTVLIGKIEKTGFRGGKTFEPLSKKADEFFVGQSGALMDMKNEDTISLYIPIFTTPNTENGKYKIFFSIKCDARMSAKDAALSASKLALGALTGIKMKTYIPLEIENKVNTVDGRNKFIEPVGVRFGNFESYYPVSIESSYIKTINLYSNKGGLVAINIQKTYEDEEYKEKILGIYTKHLLREKADEITPINLSGVTLELHRIRRSRGGKELQALRMVGYIPQGDCVLSIDGMCFPQAVSETISMLSSMEFLPQN